MNWFYLVKVTVYRSASSKNEQRTPWADFLPRYFSVISTGVGQPVPGINGKGRLASGYPEPVGFNSAGNILLANLDGTCLLLPGGRSNRFKKIHDFPACKLYGDVF
jgi:hypothetical protein